MGKKIYVGNLPFSTNDSQLFDMFASYGAVESARIVTDRATGRSKGFGFVEMSTDDEAQAAIDGLNGYDMQGRALNVSEARPQEPRRDFGGGGGGGGGRDRDGGGRRDGGYGGGGGGGGGRRHSGGMR